VFGKGPLAIGLTHDRDNAIFHELPRGLADEQFFFRELRVDVEVIDAGETSHDGSVASAASGRWVAIIDEMNRPPVDPEFETRIRDSFQLQKVMPSIGATLETVTPGFVEIRLPYSENLTQQHGYLHAGIVTTIVDSACGYAAYTLAAADTNVLTVEYKVNFLSPARGQLFIASGRVLKAGRTLTVCQGEVMAHDGDLPPAVIATMLATIMILHP
jgi:uncharacterized protein (TIGR00369 family)